PRTKLRSVVLRRSGPRRRSPKGMGTRSGAVRLSGRGFKALQLLHVLEKRTARTKPDLGPLAFPDVWPGNHTAIGTRCKRFRQPSLGGVQQIRDQIPPIVRRAVACERHL